MHALTYCLNCMNRLHSLTKTVVGNLDAIDSTGDAKLLVLLYGDWPGTAEYLFSHHGDAIESGLLEVVEYHGAAFYHRSHATNLSVLASDTEFVFDIGADTILTRQNCNYTLDAIQRGIESGVKWWACPFQALLARSLFLQVGGYDETFVGWGFEDYDLIERLKLSDAFQIPMGIGYEGWKHHNHLSRTRSFPARYGDVHGTDAANKKRAEARPVLGLANYRQTWGSGCVTKNNTSRMRLGAYTYDDHTEDFTRNEVALPDEMPGVYDVARGGVRHASIALLANGEVRIGGETVGLWQYVGGRLLLLIDCDHEPEFLYHEVSGCLSTLDRTVVITKCG